MKPLYEIKQDFQNWLLKIEDNEGEVTEELMTEFNNIDGDFEVKAEAYAVLIKQKIAEIELINAEKERLRERQEQVKKTVNGLTERLAKALNLFGKDKFETPKCKVSFTKSTSTKIIDESKIKKIFFKVTKTPMLNEIKAAILRGEKVAGAVLVENKNIQIK